MNEQEHDVPMRQFNIGKIPEPMREEIDNMFRKLNVYLTDAGHKAVPQYISFPSLVWNKLRETLKEIEDAHETTRRQFIIDEIMHELREIVERYTLER